jgi:hypothetical protein
MAEKLTDRTAKTSNFADGDLVHVVDVSDTSQDPAGSSFKSTIGNIYGSYLAPKITSAQIVTNAADTYSVTLADTVSSNHFLFLQTASGDPFVDVTVTSYANPKDGAILVMKLNRAGTDDLTIPGFSAGTGFGSGIYTARYSTSLASWLPVNYLPLSAVEDFTDLGDVPSSYSGQANKIVKVKNDETGLEFGDSQQGDLATWDPTLTFDGTVITSGTPVKSIFSQYGNVVNCSMRIETVNYDFSSGSLGTLNIPLPFGTASTLVGVANVDLNNTVTNTSIRIRLASNLCEVSIFNNSGVDTGTGILSVNFQYYI